MSLQRKKREQFNYIFFGFFEENNFEITNIETKDIKFASNMSIFLSGSMYAYLWSIYQFQFKFSRYMDL